MHTTMDLTAHPYELNGLRKINVLLGKNGCGKSTALKAAEAQGAPQGLNTRYVTPERGGALTFEANVEQSMLSGNWLAESRRANQFDRFRQQSFIQLRQLELQVLRNQERDGVLGDFGRYMERINGLLDNIELRREDGTFPIISKNSGQPVAATVISSGESELISLGIEVLMFAQGARPEATSILFLDEPDVHLHPDLQVRLVDFLCRIVQEHEMTVVMATHSTPILGGLAVNEDAAVCFMRTGQHQLEFEPISEVHRRVLPVFGAHPLSNIFNSVPLLLVEGEDDVRIWQQAVRSSAGAIRLYPVHCDSITLLHEYEVEVAKLVEAVYDGGRAYSLRDGDGLDDPLQPHGSVTRLRLACRAAENLLLSDEALDLAGTTWDEVQARIEHWLTTNRDHPRHRAVAAFAAFGFDRRQHDLKDLRMLLAGEMVATNKPWEVLVGQAIAAVDPVAPPSADSLTEYLGHHVVGELLR